MSGLEETDELGVGNQRHAFSRPPADVDDVAILKHVVEEPSEVLAGFGVGDLHARNLQERMDRRHHARRVMLLLESKMKGMPEDAENGRQEGALLPSAAVPVSERLMALVLDGVTSPESRRAYERGLREFLSWLPPRPFTRASVQEYRAHLEASGRAPSTINLRLAPIRKLALEASDNGLLDPARAVAIARVKGVRRHGVRLGNWVGAEEAGRLLASPYTGSLRGKRDHAILGSEPRRCGDLL